MRINILGNITFITLLLSMYFAFPQSGLAYDVQAMAASITARHRPRVVYFYATWCGVCQQYGPKLKQTVANYANYVDLQSVNTDDSGNSALTQYFHITGLPTTYIFDVQGRKVFSQVGMVDQMTIDHVLRSIYTQANKQPGKNSKTGKTK
jgi:thioredoxin-like negative regulator of GroEL